MTQYTVPFGEHKNRSLEQVALSDYPFFARMIPSAHAPKYRNRMNEIRTVLNDFQADEACNFCSNPSTHTGITYELRHVDVTRNGRRIQRDYKTLWFDNPTLYCSTCKPNDRMTGRTSGEMVLAIQFDSLIKQHFSKKDLEKLHKLFRRAAGFNEKRLTKQVTADFINELVRKYEKRQTGSKPPKLLQQYLFNL